MMLMKCDHFLTIIGICLDVYDVRGSVLGVIHEYSPDYQLIVSPAWEESCRNKSLAPFNIRTNVAVLRKFPLIETIGFHEMNTFKLTNNGFTVHVNIPPTKTTSWPVISGGPLETKYKFADLHYHWTCCSNKFGSEFTMDGTRYPLELHAVFYKDQFKSLTDALSCSEGVVVTVFHFKETTIQFSSGDYLITNLKLVKNCNGSVELSKPMTLSALVPLEQLSTDFFIIRSPSPTPPCDPNVLWIIFHRTLQITKEQLNEFRHLHDCSGHEFIHKNYRRPEEDAPEGTEHWSLKVEYFNNYDLMKRSNLAMQTQPSLFHGILLCVMYHF